MSHTKTTDFPSNLSKVFTWRKCSHSDNDGPLRSLKAALLNQWLMFTIPGRWRRRMERQQASHGQVV